MWRTSSWACAYFVFHFWNFLWISMNFWISSSENKALLFSGFLTASCSSPKQTLKIDLNLLNSPNFDSEQFMICWTFWYKEHKKWTCRLARMKIWNLTVQMVYEQYQFIRKIRNKCYKNQEKYQTCSLSLYKHPSMI